MSSALAQRTPWPFPVPQGPGVDQKAKHAKDRRLASEAAQPVKATEGTWADPLDQAQTRTPKQIRGYRRGSELQHMAKVGCDITRDHIQAGMQFASDFEISELGLSSGNSLGDGANRQAPGPSMGPSKSCEVRAARQREVARVLKCIGSSATPLLIFIVVRNGNVATWCRSHAELKLNPKHEMGRFYGIMDRLCEVYGVNSERDRIKQLKASEGR